jgi:myosin heavy subunit
MNKLTKIILTFLLLVTVAMGYSTVAMADSKSELKQKEKQLITEMVQEIEDLGATPIKKGFKGRKKYISALKEQLEDIKKAKKKADEKKKAENNKADEKKKAEKKKQALMDDLRKQIIDLDPDAKLVTDDSSDVLDKDKDIIALKKQLEDIINAKKRADEKRKAEKKKADEKRKAEKKKQALMDDLRKQIIDLDPDAKLVTDGTDELDQDKDIIALKKQLEDIINAKKRADEKRKAEKKKADEKRKAEEAKEKEKEKRVAVIVRVKKEIYFLGGTPMAEFEVESEDAYIEALKKQIEELKIQKEAEEKEIAESIPEWYLMPPQGSDVLMYVRGSAVSDQLQLALDFATNAALKNLGKKVETRVASKAKQTIRQAGMGEDQVSKTEINLISSTVMDEVTLSGYETVETKLVSLDNGSYRAFILLKYPVAKAYKSYIEKIDKSPELKGRLTKIKGTDIYKELKKAVARYSGYSGS